MTPIEQVIEDLDKYKYQPTTDPWHEPILTVDKILGKDTLHSQAFVRDLEARGLVQHWGIVKKASDPGPLLWRWEAQRPKLDSE